MKFEAKKIPEGINTSKENPLKEFFILLTGAGIVLATVFLVLVLLSDYLVRFIPVETEQQWFDSSQISFLHQDTPSTEFAQVNQYLTKLVQQLTPKDSNSAIQYSIQLIEGDAPNAFITPGGHIFLTRQLLDYVNSENALSMVIAHEMAHQIHRHPIRSMGRGMVIAVALMIFTGIDGSGWVSGMFAESVNLGLLAYSRDQEREADNTGLKLLSEHYGHAAGSSYFFSQLLKNKKYEQAGLSEYFSTHPDTSERLDFLKQFEPDQTTELVPLPDTILEFITEKK